MAMITSVTVNKTSEKRSPDRTGKVGPDRDLSDHYAALLRVVQTEKAAQRLACYCLGVTSCNRGAGVTTVAANLSIVAARGGHQRVLLVDANIRHAQIAKLLRITGIGGLTDVLGGTSLVGDCVQMSSIDSLSVLPAGSRDRALGADFEVSDVVALLDELRSEFDLIIFDLPETNELSECYAFSQALDGLFLVIEAGRVDARNARRATQRFAHCQVNVLGAIYNKNT